ncbi:MAG: gfo/Idh/MocA family oxidoreductase, partial [Bacillota bacterium]
GLEPERKVVDTGAIVLGDKGNIMYGSHGAGGLRIFPETQMKSYKQPPKTLPRVKSHHQDWVNAIRNGKRSGSDFSYGGPLTEIALLGIIATRMLGQELQWDSKAMRFTNNDQANQFVKPTFRKGWEL